MSGNPEGLRVTAEDFSTSFLLPHSSVEWSVKRTKGEIQTLTGISWDTFELYFNSQLLDDDSRLLSSYGIVPGSAISYALRKGLFVADMGSAHSIQIRRARVSWTMGELTQAVAEEKNVHPDTIRLLFRNGLIQNDQVLSNHGVQNGERFVLAYRPTGGFFIALDIFTM